MTKRTQSEEDFYKLLISHVLTDLYLPMYSDSLLLLWMNFLCFYFLLFSHAAWHVKVKFPDQEPNPCPLHWKQGVLTTGQPGQFLDEFSSSQRGRTFLLCNRSLLPSSPLFKVSLRQFLFLLKFSLYLVFLLTMHTCH